MLDAGRLGQHRGLCGAAIQGGNSNPDSTARNDEYDHHYSKMMASPGESPGDHLGRIFSDDFQYQLQNQ